MVGYSDAAAGGVTLVHRHRPNLTVIDLDLPPLGGLPAVVAMRRHHRPGRIAVVAGEDPAAKVPAALSSGADGVLSRALDAEAVAAALLAIGSGSLVLPVESHRFIAGFGDPRHHELIDRIAPQDRRVWRLVAEGHNMRALACRLMVSERTAKRLVAHLLRELGVANRIQAAALAGRVGLFDD